MPGSTASKIRYHRLRTYCLRRSKVMCKSLSHLSITYAARLHWCAGLVLQLCSIIPGKYRGSAFVPGVLTQSCAVQKIQSDRSLPLLHAPMSGGHFKGPCEGVRHGSERCVENSVAFGASPLVSSCSKPIARHKLPLE